jgi:hypothetical protein
MSETAAPESEPTTIRRLNLIDAMIFIIALGLGLALARPAFTLIADAVSRDPHWRFQRLAGAVSLARMLNIVLLNFLFFLLPAVLIVRLRRPRPPLRSLIDQPGFVACALPVVIVLVTLPLAFWPLPGAAGGAVEFGVQALLITASPLAWVSLIATRRWNPERSWIDRLGRLLGALGMICTAAHFIFIHLPY